MFLVLVLVFVVVLTWFLVLVLLLVLLIMHALCRFFACKSHYFRRSTIFTLLIHTHLRKYTHMQTDRQTDHLLGRQEEERNKGTAIGNSFVPLLLLSLLLLFFFFNSQLVLLLLLLLSSLLLFVHRLCTLPFAQYYCSLLCCSLGRRRPAICECVDMYNLCVCVSGGVFVCGECVYWVLFAHCELFSVNNLCTVPTDYDLCLCVQQLALKWLKGEALLASLRTIVLPWISSSNIVWKMRQILLNLR